MMSGFDDRIYRKFLGMSGLAARAGKVICGAELCGNAVKRGKVFLVVLAEDTAANTAEKIMKVCGNRVVPVITAGNMDSLGRSVGKEGIAVFGVTDNSFAVRIMELYKLL